RLDALARRVRREARAAEALFVRERHRGEGQRRARLRGEPARRPEAIAEDGERSRDLADAKADARHGRSTTGRVARPHEVTLAARLERREVGRGAEAPLGIVVEEDVARARKRLRCEDALAGVQRERGLHGDRERSARRTKLKDAVADLERRIL